MSYYISPELPMETTEACTELSLEDPLLMFRDPTSLPMIDTSIKMATYQKLVFVISLISGLAMVIVWISMGIFHVGALVIEETEVSSENLSREGYHCYSLGRVRYTEGIGSAAAFLWASKILCPPEENTDDCLYSVTRITDVANLFAFDAVFSTSQECLESLLAVPICTKSVGLYGNTDFISEDWTCEFSSQKHAMMIQLEGLGFSSGDRRLPLNVSGDTFASFLTNVRDFGLEFEVLCNKIDEGNPPYLCKRMVHEGHSFQEVLADGAAIGAFISSTLLMVSHRIIHYRHARTARIDDNVVTVELSVLAGDQVPSLSD